MLKTVIKAELKNMTRDSSYLFFFIYPVILGVAGYFLIPYLESTTAPSNPIPQIVAMFLILITGFVFGVVTGFALLDDKDDNVLMSLKITPISVKVYVIIKLIISYIFGILAIIILTLATNFLPGSSVWTIILIAIIGAVQAPMIALIVNSFARNKVEGFVIMKLSGMLLMIPILVFFIFSWQEVFLVFVPAFWPARLIQMELLPQYDVNFTFIVYFIIGVIYNIAFAALLMKIYTKRSNI
ncbi:MAG: hypothetical protein KAU02_03695 [Tenericutes bacterium]|nr:hypothetical protein [Mycoplasmatota bacterium]